MTKVEHLLQKLQEECAEVIQEASKVNLFGLDDHYGERPTNAARLESEFEDLLGAYEMLVDLGVLRKPRTTRVWEKKEKIKHYMEYAKQRGTLTL